MEPGDRAAVDVRTVSFTSGDGTMLEGDLLTPPDPTGTAVVAHPHPLYGGTRHDLVVAALCRGFVDAGRRVLRFDFRGTGGSGGSHDGGLGEQADLLAAIEAVEPAPTDLVVAGYSFGADIALATDHPCVESWLVVAPPLSVVAVEEMPAASDERPVHVLHPVHDQFNPLARLRTLVDTWTNASVHELDGVDHFLHGAHPRVAALATRLSDRD